jgi:hypothetical protein
MHGSLFQGMTPHQTAPLELRYSFNAFKAGTIDLANLIERIKGTTSQAIRLLYRFPHFNRAFATAKRFVPYNRVPVFSWTFSENHLHRFTLLGLHKNTRIPVHDHPSMISILFVLSGQIHTSYYDVVKISPRSSIVELARHSERILFNEDVALVIPENGALHSLKALSTNAVFLSLQIITHHDSTIRSWYLPIAPPHNDGTYPLWHRIQNLELPDAV